MSESVLDKLNRAMQLQIQGQLKAAEAVYLEVLRSEPDNADGNHLLGLIRSEQDRDDEALALIEKAIRINPKAAPFHHNIAGIYRRLGKLREAEAEFRRAIELKPDYGEAYQGLAEMVRFEKGDPLLESILHQLSGEGIEPSMASYFHFAAGKICDDTGDYRNAFKHYVAGNRKAGKSFDSAAFRQQIKDTIYTFSPSLLEELVGAGSADERPVFIVGMPRSGTTLVEQILASHSGVCGMGELNDIKHLVLQAAGMSRIRQRYPFCVPGLGRSAWKSLAVEYLGRVEPNLGGRSFARIVDKHPLNFQYVGFILHLFPQAKIIHTVRHPLDTCLSCFFQNFTRGQHYSFDLRILAHYYVDYRRLMEHWNALYPGKIHTIAYENILEDQEAQTRRLLAFCGLDFEESCLNYHETERVVKTASFLQVRQPIYKSSRDRWKNYRTQLEEVASILGVPLENPVTISGRQPLLNSSLT